MESLASFALEMMKKPGSKAEFGGWNGCGIFDGPWVLEGFYQDPSQKKRGVLGDEISKCFCWWVASIGEPYLWEGFVRSSNFRASHFGG